MAAQRFCRDGDDDKFIHTALASSAMWLVTGDQDLLVIQAGLGLHIVAPANALLRKGLLLKIALLLQYNNRMKTATLPPIRVAPDFRIELEGVLEQGESLSQFVENAVRTTVQKRKSQAEFVRRGIAAIEETKRVGGGVPAEVVIARLEAKLAAARLAQAQRS